MAEVHEYELDNGLKILVKEDHRAPVVVSQVWYKVGASYEREGITGISHALEHMMFKGTQRYPGESFSRIIAENGGRENAFTGVDYTAYFEILESSRAPISFELEADRMRHLVLDADEFSKEIEVVKEERRLRTEDRPQSFAYEVALATAFQTGPYRHPVIGWMHDLDALEIDDLQDWYQQWYAPNNATLVVVGDVQHEAVHALAKKHFGALPPSPPIVAEARPETPQSGSKRVTIKRPAELPYLMMAYKAPSLKTALDQAGLVESWEPFALEVLAGILSGGGSARFASNLVRGAEVAASLWASYDLLTRSERLFIVGGTPAHDHSSAELEAAVHKELAALRETLVDEDELQRVKTQVVAGDVYQKDSVFYQAMLLGRLVTVDLPWQIAETYVASIQSVTAAQVRAVARKYLQPERLTVAVLEPETTAVAGP